MCELVLLCVCACEKDQRPAVNEKLAASLILLREALLLGLSMDKGVFTSGGGRGLATAESSVLPGGSHVLSPSTGTSGSSLTVGGVFSSKRIRSASWRRTGSGCS